MPLPPPIALGPAPSRRRVCSSLALLLAGACAPEPAFRARMCEAGGTPEAAALAPPVLPDRETDLQTPLPATLRTRLDGLFAEGVAGTGATAASIMLAVRDTGSSRPAGVWSASLGLDDGPRDFWWASAGKMVTASIILQLVDEGRLSLDNPLSHWFPRFPQAGQVSIDHLLTHTSGIFSFEKDRRLQAHDGYTDPQALLAASARQGLDFCPGAAWLYSNTGYLMLSMIAEQVGRRSFAQLVQQRVASRTGARTLRTLGPDTDPASVVAPVGRPGNVIGFIARFVGAAPVVGTPDDMVRVLEGGLTGRLISPDQRGAALRRLYPMPPSRAAFYGRGVMVIEVPDTTRRTRWVGHLGGSPDAKAVLVYDTRRQATLALALNTDADAERLAMALLALLD